MVTSPEALARDMSDRSVQVAMPSTFDASLASQLSSLPDVESETRLGATMLQLDFNVHRSPLDAVTVRQGIAHAIDRVAIVNRVSQPLEHLAWLDNSHLFANLQGGYVDDGAGYERLDMATADGLLTQSGLVADSHGTWTLHGAPVTLDLTWAEDDPWSSATGPLVASELVDAGFDVDTQPVPGSQLDTVLPSGDFDLALVPVQASAYPSTLEQVFSPTTTATATSTGEALTQDWTGFDDTKIDTLFAQAQGELSANQAAATYQQIDQDLWSDMPTLPLLAEPEFVAYSASVAGVQTDPGGLGALWDMNQWVPLVGAHPPTRTKEALQGSR